MLEVAIIKFLACCYGSNVLTPPNSTPTNYLCACAFVAAHTSHDSHTYAPPMPTAPRDTLDDQEREIY